MGRPKTWKEGTFKRIHIKVPNELYVPYKKILNIRKRNVQQDIQDYIQRTITQ